MANNVLDYRYHVVQEFNKGVYDYIIATDESGAHGGHDEEDEEEEEDKEGEDEESEEREDECQSHSNLL
jgi:ATP-dependent RNA helicase DDX56/DBP9